MSTIIEEKSVKGLHEIALFSFIAVAIFYLLSLLTFSHQDAGWSHSGSNIVMRNAGGLVGAWLADFSFSFFGVIAFSFPLIIFWQGYLFFSRKNKRNTTGFMQAMRWLGLIVAIISASTFCYLHIFRCPIELPRNSGGIIGQELGEVAIVTFGNSGATLLLIAVFFSSITLYTHISWLRLMETVGKNTLFFISLCYKKLTLLLDEVKTKRAENREVFEPVNIRLTQKPATKIKTILPVNFTEIKEEVIPASSVITKNTKIDLCKDIEPKAIPDTKLLDLRIVSIQGYSANELEYMSRLVEQSLQDFNVIAEVTDVLPGPVIIRFEMQPAAGVKVSRISSLAKDLARSLSVTSVRIVEIIAGKSVIGLEIPNQQREMVSFRKGLESTEFIKSKSPLSLFLGKDIAGMPMVADLAKMPHLLVAGTTGSGKSVAVNTMIMSILYKATPSDVKMIMIDPKMLELSVYEGIPHLLTPVVTDMKDAANALRWAVAEMERRYKLMSKVGVRNLSGFNRLVSEAEKKGDPLKDPMYSDETDLAEGESIPTLSTIPNIVIVIDELADMMMIVGKKVEELIARLAQKARAAGIHLILATQRPSVDVLTGLIKANIPSRISFQVSSRIDSRTVLDQGGAEFLLGNGDMLFMPSGVNIPIRVHGAFVDDHEVHHVVEFLKKTAPANYLQDITQEHSESNDGSFSTGQEAIDAEKDDLYDQAVAFVTESRKASISSVQRRFKVGYNRAATMIEAMEMAEIISPAEGSGSRQVLAPAPVR